MGVASGCGEQEVGVASGSGWNLWVWLLGVVLRRHIDFLILLIPTPLVSVLFCSSIPTSFFILLIYYIIASEASFLVSSMAQIFSLSIYIYIFQAVCRSVNVLNVSTCKYPHNAIFRNANINTQRANVTGSMIWHTNLRPPM